jgi:hypothetical protein
MAFVPASKLTQVQGEERMTDYRFGKKRIHHSFCSVCGVRPFGRGQGDDGSAWAMVNVRCLDGVDSHALKISRQFDGRNL